MAGVGVFELGFMRATGIVIDVGPVATSTV